MVSSINLLIIVASVEFFLFQVPSWFFPRVLFFSAILFVILGQ